MKILNKISAIALSGLLFTGCEKEDSDSTLAAPSVNDSKSINQITKSGGSIQFASCSGQAALFYNVTTSLVYFLQLEDGVNIPPPNNPINLTHDEVNHKLTVNLASGDSIVYELNDDIPGIGWYNLEAALTANMLVDDGMGSYNIDPNCDDDVLSKCACFSLFEPKPTNWTAGGPGAGTCSVGSTEGNPGCGVGCNGGTAYCTTANDWVFD